MANGAIKLTWRDRNWAEQGHYIYRSDTPMDVNNLPNPIATLEVNEYEYIDYDVIADQTYYYRIGAFRNSDVSVSDEIEVVATPETYDIHDIFNDGTSVATFQFNSNTSDLGGTYTPIESSGIEYVEGMFGEALKSTSSSYLRLPSTNLNLGTSSWTFSIWCKPITLSSTTTSFLFSKAREGTPANRYAFGLRDNAFIVVLDNGTTAQTITIPTTTVLDVWTHYVLVFERGVGSRVYVNGIEEYSGAPVINTNEYTSSYEFGIGSYANSSGTVDGNLGFNGLIDQMRIFNRVINSDELEVLRQEKR